MIPGIWRCTEERYGLISVEFKVSFADFHLLGKWRSAFAFMYQDGVHGITEMISMNKWIYRLASTATMNLSTRTSHHEW
jgi:hypothetical protein